MNLWKEWKNWGNTMDDFRSAIKSATGGLGLKGVFGQILGSLLMKLTDAGMTQGQTERADRQLEDIRLLNEEEYDRKIDFYERFESPSAMVGQYKAAGLNPALMYGSGASVSASGGIGSAGSVSQASGADGFNALLGMISTLSGIKQRKQQMEMENEIYRDQNDIKRQQVDVQRLQAVNYGRYLDALTTGKNQENQVFFEMFGLKKSNIEADTALKDEQKNYFVQVATSEVTRRDLMESGIRLNDANTACAEIQKAILVCQERYSDKYFKALADYQQAQADIAGIESSIYQDTKERRLQAAESELCDIIIRAGMDAEIFTGDAFKKSVEGDLTKKDWTQIVSKIVGAVVAGGAVVGSAALRAGARAVTPVSPWQGGYSPAQQYQFWNATGTRL